MKALIAAALIMGSGVSTAQTPMPTASTDSNAPAGKVKPPKPLCRNESTTGSMFAKKTCHSKEEWAAIDLANAADVERISNARKAGRN